MLALILASSQSACNGCHALDSDVFAIAPPQTEVHPPGLGPRLVVLIVIDQWPSWSFERDRSSLKGGLGRLLESGVVAAAAEFPYANTYTAPGHAAIATGAPPSITGILGNSWYRRGKGRLSCVLDQEYDTFGVEESVTFLGVSSKALRTDGIADVLRESTQGRGHSVSISLKDRSAILLLGRRPDLALWYEPSIPGMTTSSFYSPKLPAWVEHLNRNQPEDRYRQVWTPDDAELLAKVTGLEDDEDGEGHGFGFTRSFPHKLGETEDPAKALRITPAGTDLLLDTARAAVTEMSLGQDDVPDLLGLSISNHDYAGHFWGQESWERLDLLLRLDRDLGKFFTFLDSVVGEDRYAVVVTSDHGANRLVENTVSTGVEAHRVSTQGIVEVADRAAVRVLGPGKWADSCTSSNLYMSDAFEALPEERRELAVDAVAKAVASIPGVGYVKKVSDVSGDCSWLTGIDALACHSTSDESGTLFVTAGAGSIISSGYTSGTSHGTPSREDRFVPLIISAPGLAARKVEEGVGILQVAPSVSKLLGVPSPPSARAPPISDLDFAPSASRAEPAQ